MSTVSEQNHLNPRDPLYYAPRFLRERPGSKTSSLHDAPPGTPFSPASFDSQLESAVSDALRHPLDPEVMHEPGYADGMEPRKALWSVTARFAAAVGVAATVALFFVVAVPVSRQADGDTSSALGMLRSVKAALFSPGIRDDASKPALSEFQAAMAAAPASTPPASGQGPMLKQFMQWREKPNATAP